MDEHFTAPKSEYEVGYDMGGKEEATLLLMDEIEDYLLDGIKPNSISQWLVQERGFKGYAAKTIVSKVWKNLMNLTKKSEDNMKQKNLARLERLYALAVDSGDYANANKALDTLNKMCKLYTEKIEVEAASSVFIMGGVGDDTKDDND